jgi:hypothetical protein
MIKVAALTSGKNLPSARFRVRQHIEALKSYQIHVDEYVPITGKGRKISSSPNSGNPRNSSALYLAWRGAKTVSRLPGVLGRQITLENFSQQIITKKIATLFKELV